MRERSRPDVPALFEKVGGDVFFVQRDLRLRLRAEDELREVRRDLEIALFEAFDVVDDVVVFVGVDDVGVRRAAVVPLDGGFGVERSCFVLPSRQSFQAEREDAEVFSALMEKSESDELACRIQQRCFALRSFESRFDARRADVQDFLDALEERAVEGVVVVESLRGSPLTRPSATLSPRSGERGTGCFAFECEMFLLSLYLELAMEATGANEITDVSAYRWLALDQGSLSTSMTIDGDHIRIFEVQGEKKHL